MPTEVPTKYVELLEVKGVQRLTLKQRLKLILGFNILVEVRICTQHKVGKTLHKVTLSLTDLEKTPPSTSEAFAKL